MRKLITLLVALAAAAAGFVFLAGAAAAQNDPHPGCPGGHAYVDRPAGELTYVVPQPPQGWYYASITLKGPNVNSGAVPSGHVTFSGPFYGGEVIPTPFFKNGDPGHPMAISHADWCKVEKRTTTTTQAPTTTTTTTTVAPTTTTTEPPTTTTTTEVTTSTTTTTEAPTTTTEAPTTTSPETTTTSTPPGSTTTTTAAPTTTTPSPTTVPDSSTTVPTTSPAPTSTSVPGTVTVPPPSVTSPPPTSPPSAPSSTQNEETPDFTCDDWWDFVGTDWVFWNTGDLAPGEYIIEAGYDALPGDPLDGDNDGLACERDFPFTVSAPEAPSMLLPATE